MSDQREQLFLLVPSRLKAAVKEEAKRRRRTLQDVAGPSAIRALLAYLRDPSIDDYPCVPDVLPGTESAGTEETDEQQTQATGTE